MASICLGLNVSTKESTQCFVLDYLVDIANERDIFTIC